MLYLMEQTDKQTKKKKENASARKTGYNGLYSQKNKRTCQP